jgi:hypothetical protein
MMGRYGTRGSDGTHGANEIGARERNRRSNGWKLNNALPPKGGTTYVWLRRAFDKT